MSVPPNRNFAEPSCLRAFAVADRARIIWVVSDVYQQIIQTLSRLKRILVTTHVRPDGDAIGTSAALVLALKKVGIDAEVLLLSHLPRKYAFVFHEHEIPFIDVESGWPDDFAIDGFDGLIVADTGTWSQLPGLRERLANFSGPKIVIDHHQTQEDWAHIKLVVPEAAAAGEIAAELFEQWQIPLDRAIATCLYVAIATDTGWFQFANTRPFTLRLAATLIEAGVDTDRLYQLLYQNERPERVVLQTRAMQSMQLLSDARIAVMTITKRDFADTHASVADTENLINIPLQIRTVEVSILFVEPIDFGPVRVSLRSKGQVDVARFAEQFGGGGHTRAAGLKLDNAPLESVRQRIVEALVQSVEG